MKEIGTGVKETGTAGKETGTAGKETGTAGKETGTGVKETRSPLNRRLSGPHALHTDKADFIATLAQLICEYFFLGKALPLCYAVLVNKTIVKIKMIVQSKHNNIFNNVKFATSLLLFCVLTERSFWFYTTTQRVGSYKKTVMNKVYTQI